MTQTQTHPVPTLSELAAAVGGQISRRGTEVIVGYGRDGYLSVTPSWVIVDGREVAAASVEGRLDRGNGGAHSALREKLRAAEIYPE